MTPLVIDASVAVKWFLRSSNDEDHTEEALHYLQTSSSGEVYFVQPPHFLAEVAAVLTRLNPRTSSLDIDDLLSLQFTVPEDAEIYQTARRLAVELDHHLFDTMYHAVALTTPEAVLITADRRYHQKAKGLGAIKLLGS